MATTVYFRADATADNETPGIHLGTNNAKLDGSAAGWLSMALTAARGFSTSAALGRSASTVNGPTSGVEVLSTYPYEWISAPLDADVTISGTITFNLWALESNMAANAAINCVLERLDSTGAIISTILKTTRTTELGTGAAAANFTGTPTSTSMAKGDRIRARVFIDDATANMATGYVATFYFGRDTAGVQGDSYITFTETFGFLTTDPSGTTLYLTDNAGPAVGADIEREMWTSRGSGVVSDTVNTAAGWTAPIRWTDTAGGTAVEWYSRPLAAFTLDGLVLVNLRALESDFAANTGIRAEIAVVNGDGSGAAIWGSISIQDEVFAPTFLGSYGELLTTEQAVLGRIAGDAHSVTDGQRLRLRVYIDDCGAVSMVTGHSATLYYAGTSGGASGDSFVTLPQSVSENSAALSFVLPSFRSTSTLYNL